MTGIDIQVACETPGIPSRRAIRNWVRAALGDRARAELTVRIVDLAEGRELNRRWRGADRATNVLSFPATDVEHVAPGLLGDIVICAPVVMREASEQHKAPAAHWAHMVIHGVLHLLGHDHESDRDARRMEKLELEILATLGYPDPYQVEPA